MKIASATERIERFLKPTLTSVAGRTVQGEDFVGARILDALARKEPLAVGRFGTTEGTLIDALRRNRGAKDVNLLTREAWQLSGLFPATPEQAWSMHQVYLDCLANFDLIGVRTRSHDCWFRRIEKRLVEHFTPHAQLFAIENLTPGDQGSAWYWNLSDVQVLVMMPFAASIQRAVQSPRSFSLGGRDAPHFDFTYIQTVQSLSGTALSVGYPSWSDALQTQTAMMDSVQFDIALIAGGAYGAPLAAHAKNLGRVGVHVGGSLQLLFGISGTRWTDPLSPDYRPESRSEGWRYPDAEDRIPCAELVENACYWAPKQTENADQE